MTKVELNRHLKAAGLTPRVYKCSKDALRWTIKPQPCEVSMFPQSMETFKSYLAENGIRYFDKFQDCLQVYS